ncbi:hypothetical protein SuNHUV7_15910 (plasmid) [Pseudoseohaeicola sp. NH-UV-7]|jgi:hypothetical protein|uniref:DUF1523 family protein n=1 Tax=unclassified Sulfitobacter TaxID=196795 RepID=UPI000E0C2272|nr:DUF1523 family protein [Sulfitobacter sp. JL08]AXI56385.1 DUF1523 domain-containing protein [Sulfitobacter sp. JL08]
MKYIKWALIIAVWVFIGSFLHYTLPQRDVVRITDTYLERIDFGENSIFWSHAQTGDNPNLTNRDVFFIQAFKDNGKPIIYRNEDTGWGWPPFFKFDTSNLQAEASDLESKTTAGGAQWAVIRHYGWRNEFLSIYPNALGVKPATGPDHQLGLPWLNIIILTLLAALVYGIWVRWRRFRQRRIDPTLEEISDSWEAAGDAVDERRGRIRRWFDSWRSK